MLAPVRALLRHGFLSDYEFFIFNHTREMLASLDSWQPDPPAKPI